MPYQYAHYTKRKGGQVRFTATQTDALEKRFNSNKYLSPEDRRLLADSLKLTDRQVLFIVCGFFLKNVGASLRYFNLIDFSLTGKDVVSKQTSEMEALQQFNIKYTIRKSRRK